MKTYLLTGTAVLALSSAMAVNAQADDAFSATGGRKTSATVSTN
ncbi:hypothetical protein ABI_42710 [Asticcacaulis biprosthecium C19]|uniref:Uncharacterized protein n=1 Tax=Asticcacaulis biprosthecium C19 TaxID=715226 RepID=F4QSX8_9CAUL|nr:hypothetical protein [Asticcacaulis biprosthecium]EGF89848.1 hypothetical protein ABI_42710 [Asticcacaulis biprosthecium C19]